MGAQTIFESRREKVAEGLRVEYPLVVSVWRFVTVARGLLTITVVAGMSAIMNTVRANHFKTREVILTETGQSLTIANDSINYLTGAGLIFTLGIVAVIVVRIDYELKHLQEQCVERGIIVETSLGLGSALFHRAVAHRLHIERPFSLARWALALITFGWIWFVFSISQ